MGTRIRIRSAPRSPASTPRPRAPRRARTRWRSATWRCASHIALVSPIWWGSVPALLKGFFDRTLQARWAYHYTSRGPVGHLKGRTGRVFLTTDSPGWYLRAVAGRPTERQLVGGTLKFCGIKPVAVTRFGPVRTSTPAKRGGWLDRVAQLAAHDATRVSPTPPPPVVVTGDLPIAR